MGGDGGLRTLAATIIGFYLGYALKEAALIMLGSAAVLYVLYKYIQMIDRQKLIMRMTRRELHHEKNNNHMGWEQHDHRNGGP
jgi:uncharacterized membrane protein